MAETDTAVSQQNAWVVLVLSAAAWIALCVWAVQSLPERANTVAQSRDMTSAPASDDRSSAMETMPDGQTAARVDKTPDGPPSTRAVEPDEPVEAEQAPERAESAGVADVGSAPADTRTRDLSDAAAVGTEGAADEDANRRSNPTNDGNEADLSAEAAFIRERQRELAVLDNLAERLQFPLGKARRTPSIQQTLDRMFDPLFLYAETRVEVLVNSNDLASPADNRALSEARGRVIVDYLVQRGLSLSRFEIVSYGGRGLRIDAHEVRLTVEVID